MRLNYLVYLLVIVVTSVCQSLDRPDISIDLGSIESVGRLRSLCIPINTETFWRPGDDLDLLEGNIDYDSRMLLKDSNTILSSPDIYLVHDNFLVLSTRIAPFCVNSLFAPGVYDVVLEVIDLRGTVYHLTASVTVKPEAP